MGQPGKLSFDLIQDGTVSFFEGSPCSLVVDGRNIFFGWVFSKSRRDNRITSVVAYDQLRYLKSTDTRVFAAGSTAAQRFSRICEDFQLKHRVVHAPTFLLPLRNHENKTLADMIDDGIHLTLIHSGSWYVVRDNFGTLEWLNIAQLRTNLILGEASLLTGYSYQTSIDEDTYNRIKLIQENKAAAKREVYIVEDSSTIARWGLLQYSETVDEDANAAQIALRAEQLLKLKNRVTRKLTLDAIGDWRVMPGNSVWVSASLDDVALSRYMLVHGVSHTIKNKLHTMRVTLEVAE